MSWIVDIEVAISNELEISNQSYIISGATRLRIGVSLTVILQNTLLEIAFTEIKKIMIS
jgi:hypothetical protein